MASVSLLRNRKSSPGWISPMTDLRLSRAARLIAVVLRQLQNPAALLRGNPHRLVVEHLGYQRLGYMRLVRDKLQRNLHACSSVSHCHQYTTKLVAFPVVLLSFFMSFILLAVPTDFHFRACCFPAGNFSKGRFPVPYSRPQNPYILTRMSPILSVQKYVSISF